jgi:uncharacterized delta-60 repeat protein
MRAHSWLGVVALLAVARTAQGQFWTVDPSFSPVLESSVEPLSPQPMASPGGKCLVVGRYAINGTVTNTSVVRLGQDGVIDPSFHAPASGYWTPLAVYPDGRVLSQVDAADGRHIVRLLASGAIDPAFASVSIADNAGARLLGDGRILLYGNFTRVNGVARAGLALLDETGALSNTFVPGFASSTTVQIYGKPLMLSDGRVIVAGNFANAANLFNPIVRLNVDGSIDPSFAPAVGGFTGQIYRASDEQTVLAVRIASFATPQLVRLTAAGQLDGSFTPQLVGSPQSFGEQQADGKMYYVTNNNTLVELRRINADGTADASFVGVGQLPSISDDGGFFVGAPVTSDRRTQHAMVSRLNVDGTLDPVFAPRFGSAATVTAFERQPDGKVLATGLFSFVNGTPRPSSRYTFLRLNADGTVDQTFAPTLSEAEQVWEFKHQSAGKIVALGTFTQDGGTRTAMRFNADGSRDPAFLTSARLDWLFEFDAAGRFYSVSNDTMLRRYTADGAVDSGFQPVSLTGATNIRVAAFPDGGVVLATSSTIGQTGLVRLTETGAIDASFTAQKGNFPSTLLGLVPLPDGRLLVYGTTSTQHGTVALRYIRLARNGTEDFVYFAPDSLSNAALPRDGLVLAGVIRDLLHDAGAASDQQVRADLTMALRQRGRVAVTAGGELIADFSDDPAWPLARFARDTASGHTFDPKPSILGSAPTEPIVSLQGAPRTLSVSGGGLFPLSYQWFKNGVPLSGATSSVLRLDSMQPGDAGSYTAVVSNAYGSATSQPISVTVDSTIQPLVVSTQPSSRTAAAGATVALSATASSNPVPSFQWFENGVPVVASTFVLSGATATSTLTVHNMQPAQTGIYFANLTGGGATATTSAAILGFTTIAKVAGAASVVGSDIRHPNGNVFDQALIGGVAAAVTADPGKVTRVSYLDLDDDIVQIEFAGAGTLSLVLDAATGPAKPVKYTQEVLYVKGHAGIVIAGANETTNVSVFSVGRLTAFDPTGAFDFLRAVSPTNNPANNGSPLFQGQASTAYGGVADLAFIAISSSNGKFGGVRTANASYFANQGFTGVYAPGVNFTGPLFIGDISAFGAATPTIVIGSSPDTRVTGGDLFQDNGRAVQVAGLTQLKFTFGGDSHGNPFSAKPNQARLEQNGTDVTGTIVVNPLP